jgi:formate dehydrogenase major subunit
MPGDISWLPGRPTAAPERSERLHARTREADAVKRSVCPYCAVGCGQLIYTQGGRIIGIEGDPESPISRGRLCPKGAATFQYVTGSQREKHVLYRRPGGTDWQSIPLEQAMEMVAQRVKKTRDETWEDTGVNGHKVRRTLGIAHLGGATLDNEENYQDLRNADCILIQGSNMAECHPVGFQWVMEAKERGATLIHVDPRYTRTSAMANLHVPIRVGSDIAFLGGIVRYIEGFQDTEELEGLFSGWLPEEGKYDPSTWQYEGASGVVAASGHKQLYAGPGAGEGAPRHTQLSVESHDFTLQHPRCVFQLLRRHFARITITDMADGKVKGYFVMGENPTVGSSSGTLQRKGLAKLEWLVVRDPVLIETAGFWQRSPEIASGEETGSVRRRWGQRRRSYGTRGQSASPYRWCAERLNEREYVLTQLAHAEAPSVRGCRRGK